MKRTDFILFSPLLVAALVMLALPLTGAGDVYYLASASREIIWGGLIYRDVEFAYPPVYAYLMAAAMLVLGDNALA